MDQTTPNIQSGSQAAVPNPKPTWGKVQMGAFGTPERLRFIHQVYGWMSAGLIITGIVAYRVSITPALLQLVLGDKGMLLVLLLAELVLVVVVAETVHKLPARLSAFLFLLYAAFNGLTLSVIFAAFTLGSIGNVFFLTAGLFAVMSVYGYITKRDLTSLGSFALMSLMGVVIAMIINLFYRNSLADFVLSCAGVFVFVILTAYDTQKLKWLYDLGRTEGADGEKKEAINGALTLYLDFINLFLDLLKILGRRK